MNRLDGTWVNITKKIKGKKINYGRYKSKKVFSDE